MLQIKQNYDYENFIIITDINLMACGNEQAKEEPGLKDALEGKFEIGVALNTRQAAGMDTLATEIVQKHFNAIVAENAMKSGELLNEERDMTLLRPMSLYSSG